MIQGSDPARTAGPEGNGAKSLAKESKAGLAVTFVLTSAATIALDALTRLDLSSAKGWWVPILAAAAGSGAGLLTAWLKKNR